MKNLFLLLSLFVIIFTSCEEKNEVISIANPKVEIPRIKSEIVEINTSDRIIKSKKYFKLDSLGQVISIIEIQEENDTVIHEFSYKKDYIIEKKRSNFYSDSIKHCLNSDKRIEKTNFSESTISPSLLTSYSLSKKSKNMGDFTIKYDKNGYINSLTDYFYDDSLKYNLEYKNNNLTDLKITLNNIDFVKSQCEYYNYNNTTGKENFYGNIMGKQNKNLIKKMTIIHNSNIETYEYEYTFDKSNRVKTEKVVSKEENQIYRTSIRTFEYF